MSKFIEIVCSTPDTEIRYTLDNYDPNESSNLYTNWIELSSDTTVKAKAFKESYESSSISSLVVNNFKEIVQPSVTHMWQGEGSLLNYSNYNISISDGEILNPDKYTFWYRLPSENTFDLKKMTLSNSHPNIVNLEYNGQNIFAFTRDGRYWWFFIRACDSEGNFSEEKEIKINEAI